VICGRVIILQILITKFSKCIKYIGILWNNGITHFVLFYLFLKMSIFLTAVQNLRKRRALFEVRHMKGMDTICVLHHNYPITHYPITSWVLYSVNLPINCFPGICFPVWWSNGFYLVRVLLYLRVSAGLYLGGTFIFLNYVTASKTAEVKFTTFQRNNL
jgi:hypothetical protein